MQTELVINRGGFPPFSARGCQQTLQPINTGELRRTVNGELIYTGKKGHHKYQSVIECQDEAALVIEGIWRGEAITVQCIQRLWQEIVVDDETAVLNVTLDRPPVSGSIMVSVSDASTAANTDIQTLLLNEPTNVQQLAIHHHFKKGDRVYVNYRPQLQMRVIHFSLASNEWRQTCGWRLSLEEI